MNYLSDESHLQVVVDAMVDAVIIIGADGLIRAANRSVEQMLGYSKEQMLGRNVSMLMPEPHASAHDGYLQRYLEAGEARVLGKLREVAGRHADGSVIPIELGVSELRVGEAREFIGVLRDIRSRKRAEAMQKRLQTLMAQIIDGSPVPTYVINDNHQITHWNRACEAVTGKSAREMIGTDNQRRIFYGTERPTMSDIIVAGGKDKEMKEHYGDKRLTRSPFVTGSYEAEGYFPELGDGGAWLRFTVAPLTGTDGRIIGAIETLQDVTEQRETEEALLRHQKDLEAQVAKRSSELASAQLQLQQSEKLASIGQLAAGVAHEINNPIGFVHSNLSSLERYFDKLLKVLERFEADEALIEGLGEPGRVWMAQVRALKEEADYAYLKQDIPDLLAESRDGVSRVRKIVQDLRDFSRVDKAQEWEETDLRTGLDSTLNIVQNEIKYRANVVKEYSDIPPVQCFPSQLNQVFMNLMVNAAQAMPEGKQGTITLRCGTAGKEVWVEVADNGNGIPTENLKKIFDPFFTTKPVGKGTGLGLSLSYGIVQKHGGRIEVQSEVGVGTTFRVSVPARHEAGKDGKGK